MDRVVLRQYITRLLVALPNLGPNVYSAFYGCELDFGETTTWSKPCITNEYDIHKLELDMSCEYFKKLESLTAHALERCKDKFIVGYTDLHPGLDCVDAWRGTENLCMDMYDSPEKVQKLVDISIKDFHKIYDHFHKELRVKNQPSVTWLGIPSFGKMHIPSCDFSSMISTDAFIKYNLPVLQKEVKGMTHNVFHVDGRGVAKHIDVILDVPEIQAIQWVQGIGEDAPIMKWIPLLKQIQASGKSILVYLKQKELENFIDAMEPDGLFLNVFCKEEDQTEILRRIEKW